MHRWATKDTYEREEDEAARLVRPSPKVKPPRRDKRRETTQGDRDPDTAGDPDLKGDRDLSLNYKNVGGSLSRRVLARFLVAEREEANIPVWDNEKKKRDKITQKRLRNNPGRFRALKPDEVAGEEDSTGDAALAEEAEADRSELEKAFNADSEKFTDFLERNSDLARKTPDGKWEFLDEDSGEFVQLGGKGMTPRVTRDVLDNVLSRWKRDQAFKKRESEILSLFDGDKDKFKKFLTENDLGKVLSDDNFGIYDPETEEFVDPSSLPPERVLVVFDHAIAKAREKFKPSPEQVVNRFLADNKAKSDKFRAYADELPTTTEDEDGQPLFLDRSKKPKKRVPFDKLPQKEQAAIIEDFEEKEVAKAQRQKQDEAAKARLKKMQDFVRSNPKLQLAFDQISAVANDNDASGVFADRLKQLKEGDTPLDELPIAKHFPELKGVKFPDGVESIADLIEVSNDVSLPPLKRRKVDQNERSEILMRMLDVIPAAQYDGIAKLHPDDQLAIMNDASAFRRLKPKDFAAFRAKVRGIYQTDPSKIPPPEEIEWQGKTVAFASLSPQNKAQALNDYRNKVVAISVASSSLVSEELQQSGIPPALADRLLAGKAAPPPRRTYEEVLADGKVEPPPKDRRQAIREFETDEEKAQAAAYFQARDYQAIRREYLEAPTSSGQAINEHVPTKKLLKNLEEATTALREAEQAYPEAARMGNAKILRTRVLERLRALLPDGEKLQAVERWVREQDADDYDEQYFKWERAVKDMESARKKRQRGGPYREEDEPPPPPPPLKPEGYDEVRKPKPSRGKKIMDFFQTLTARPPVTAHVVARYLTCAPPPVMSNLRDRQAVYWGVEPYPAGHEGFAPYNEWEQAHARDFGAADEAALLSTARDWLGQFVLDPSIMGDGVPDARFRAALDYAIYTLENGKYSAGLHPAIYNRLLARLTGQPEDETLLTVRKTARDLSKSLYQPPPERITMQAANRIRAYAAKLASTEPHIAFDLMKLAQDAEEAEEQEAEEQGQGQKQQKKAQQKKQQGQGQQGDDEGDDKGQKKQAYVALRRAVVRVASVNPQARVVLQPVLQLIKQIG